MSLIESLTSLFAPNECLGCGREGKMLCSSCLLLLPPLANRCFGCRRPIIGVACPSCLGVSGLDSISASTSYQALAKKLVAQLKFHGNQAAARTMSNHMFGYTFPTNAILVPVPATTSHIRQRGYDQAELLTRHLSRYTQCRSLTALRRQGQRHQLGSSRQERLSGLQSSLRLIKSDELVGKHIILVDDVLTTGATLYASAKLVRQAGAQRVDGLVFAQA